MSRLRTHLLHHNVASHVALHAILAQAGRVLVLVEQDHGFEGIAVDGRARLFRWLLFRHPFVLSQAFELIKVVVFHLAVQLLELCKVNDDSFLTAEISRVVGKDLISHVNRGDSRHLGFGILDDFWLLDLLTSRLDRYLSLIVRSNHELVDILAGHFDSFSLGALALLTL